MTTPMEPPARFRRRGLAALLTGSLAAPAALADDRRLLRILVGFPPGGGLDIIARLLAERIQATSGRPVVVCQHISGSARGRILIPCASSSADAGLAADLRDQVEARLEGTASVATGLQPMERRVLTAYRMTVQRMPHRLRALMKRKAS